MEKIVKANSYILHGIDAVPVTVECSVRNGLGIHIVGLADIAVKEMLLRTITALQACGYRIPGKKIIINILPQVNLAARNVTNLDAAVAAAILAASEQEELPLLDNTVIAGELGLDGTLRPVAGCIPAADTMLSQGGKDRLLMPYFSAKETEIIRTYWPSCSTYVARNLVELVSILKGSSDREENEATRQRSQPPVDKEDDIPEEVISDGAMRALTVAAAGGFDVLLVDGKGVSAATVLSRLLPEADRKTRAKLLSAAGRPQESCNAPLRIPHALASLPAFLGGGATVTPGEVTLAHDGILCITESEMLPKSLAEALRGVHEDGTVTITRLRDKITMPADFTLALCAKQTPPSPRLTQLSTRMLYVQSPNRGGAPFTKERLAAARAAVGAARARQAERGCLNSRIPSKDLQINDPLTALAERLMTTLPISVQQYSLMIRIARTIADVDGKDNIDNAALAEAAAFLIPVSK